MYLMKQFEAVLMNYHKKLKNLNTKIIQNDHSRLSKKILNECCKRVKNLMSIAIKYLNYI